MSLTPEFLSLTCLMTRRPSTPPFFRMRRPDVQRCRWHRALPQRQATFMAMAANGWYPTSHRRTVEVDAFCSWSACRMKINEARARYCGLTLYPFARCKHHAEIAGVAQVIARVRYVGLEGRTKTQTKTPRLLSRRITG
jgi:hypothetical protein